MKYNFSKEHLEKVVKQAKSIAEVCRSLNIRPCGGNYKTLKQKFKIYDISISHFTGKGWNTGLKHKPKIEKPLTDILVENSDYVNNNFLKKRLFKANLKAKKCEICGITEWNNIPVIFELDHINGNNLDHRIENLRILCPNCHSQTPTNRGKNKLSALSERREVEFRKFGESLTANTEPSSD
jgi:hypothetical protein